jgi:hypothetical protein
MHDELYKIAIESVKQYKESNEELIDWEDFIEAIEKEYGIS